MSPRLSDTCTGSPSRKCTRTNATDSAYVYAVTRAVCVAESTVEGTSVPIMDVGAAFRRTFPTGGQTCSRRSAARWGGSPLGKEGGDIAIASVAGLAG